MNIRINIARAVALEADELYKDAKGFGQLAARALGQGKRSQITGLESIANSSLKASDVLDYLKLRTARHKEWRIDGLGKELIKYISQHLYARQEGVCRELALGKNSFEERLLRQEVYVALIRAFVAQVAAQYEYALLNEAAYADR